MPGSEFCCEVMEAFFEADVLYIEGKNDLYNIRLHWPGDEYATFIEIQYCPWCGTELSGKINIRKLL